MQKGPEIIFPALFYLYPISGLLRWCKLQAHRVAYIYPVVGFR